MRAVSYHLHKEWQQVVERAVQNIIIQYYQAAPSLRSVSFILTLVEKQWKHIKQNVFDSPLHYYTVLAKTTDHLLQFLHPLFEKQCSPLLLFERIKCKSKWRKTYVDIDMAYIDNGEWIIRKFLLEEDETFCRHYKQMILTACPQKFGFLPRKIEFCSLLNGTRHIECLSSLSAFHRVSKIKLFTCGRDFD
ncbi:hypothetical protein [Thermaerobacillus caldiproteolyticus]|uniref:hypothetical protein n=1 Tax=Thermaerobacillus caldiproteolyticus TaxID=247480 RepID=UPI00188A0434|nr:hypothetical protein [Anoxybacillus caldiproteolyticus]QPA30462.1 hypothetical protein ISX45_12625 [Anoxybacillus caldiproteolyticus]